MTGRCLSAVLLLPCLLAGTALAQLADPTRPANAALAPDLPGAVGAPLESGVQTVILRPNGKSAAVINGKYYLVGEMLGDKRIVRISESEVVLKAENGREVIKVTPAIEKQQTKRPAGAKARTRQTTEGTSAK